MTKDEANKAMDEGLRVTHKYFCEHEWVERRRFMFAFEDGIQCTPREFWRFRNGTGWDDGWSIVEEAPTEK